MIKRAKPFFICILTVLSVSVSGCLEARVSPDLTLEMATPETSGYSEVHIIDVGNADAILILNEGEAALIDGGNKGDEVVDYLNAQGVKNLKYVINTHPHADHLGVLSEVLESFPVEQLLVGNGSADSQIYRRFIETAAELNLPPSVPLEGATFELGAGLLTFYNVSNESSNVNNRSLVIYYQNGEDTFLFTGDAEKEVEEILPTFPEVDVFKAGHHGSSTSNTDAFLERQAPSMVAVSAGDGNSYGHPHREPLAYLKQHNIPVYRTDEQGDLLFISTGTGVSIDLPTASYVGGSDK